MMDKKKRHTSGSRSKSRKSKPNEFSVDLKPSKTGHWGTFHEQSKTKTESSVNKSKGSRKCQKGKKPVQVPIKRSFKDSKVHSSMTQDISHSVSADRKHSLTKMNRTEANYAEAYQVTRDISKMHKKLSRIARPRTIDPQEILHFYKQILGSIQSASQELEPLLKTMHQLYVQPFYALYQYISPYADLIVKKEELSIEIQSMIKNIDQYEQSLDPEGLQILRLKEKIAENSRVIQIRKAQDEMLRSKNSTNPRNSLERDIDKMPYMAKGRHNEDNYSQSLDPRKQLSTGFGANHSSSQQNPPSEGLGSKGLKINIQGMARGQGFHDEFYSHLDEFSQSWRNQAIREKRF